ncbi:MAG: hypothetical protein O2885_08640 [Proteobacteria bacterium]|nr:hypothetical protein [Pseudomonadota bacterium]
MKVLKCDSTIRLDLDDICEMIADGCSLAQIGAQFDRSRNVIWKFLHKNEEHRQAYLAALQERGFHHANMIERLVLKVENGEMPPDVARVAIDGRKWIASRFHPNLLSEKLIGNITHHQSSIQDQHLAALRSIVEKRKRQIEKDEKARKEEEQLEPVASGS